MCWAGEWGIGVCPRVISLVFLEGGVGNSNSGNVSYKYLS